MPVNFRKHSTLIGHPAECKCENCRDARSKNRKFTKAGYRSTTTAKVVYDHIRSVMDETNASLYQVSKATTVPYVMLMKIMDGRTSFVHQKTAVAILAIRPSDVTIIKRSRRQFDWRLGVLMAQGYTTKRIAEVAGGRIKPTANASGVLVNVSVELWDRLEKAWIELSPRLASPELDGISAQKSNEMVTRARNAGYHPLAAYDNEFDTEPADTTEAKNLILADRAHLDELVAERVKRGLQEPDITAELAHLYPDFSTSLAVDRVKTRLRRERRQ